MDGEKGERIRATGYKPVPLEGGHTGPPLRGEGDKSVFLPFYCPKMRSETLQSPCDKNLLRIKALRVKWPEAHIGPLEHCLACKGKDLVIREAPIRATGYKPVPRTPVPLDACVTDAGRETIQEDRGMAGAVKFKDEAEAERVLGSGKLPAEEVKTPEEPEAVMRTLPPEKVKAGKEAIERMRQSYVDVKADVPGGDL